MSDPPANPTAAPPPRAFTQGVGTVFQVVGVLLFLAGMFVCCASGLVSKETATRTELTRVGWHLTRNVQNEPTYSAQRAITVSLLMAIFLGMALAAVGLGLQATNRRAPPFGAVVTGLAVVFWSVHALFFASTLGSVLLGGICLLLGLVFGLLFGLSVAAVREMRRDPPQSGHELLPPGYQVPYSHLHQDPPEVRLARELEQRRQRLAVEQKELELLEEKLRRRRETPDA